MRTQFTCSTCGAPFTRDWQPSRPTPRYCSPACFGISQRKTVYATRYRFTRQPGHPLWTGQKMPEHRIILYDAIGPGPHPCHWCGKLVDWRPGDGTKGDALIVDHIDDDGQNNALDNLVVSCHRCNIQRDNPAIIGDGEVVTVRSDGARRRGQLRICEICGTAFNHPLSERRPNRGRFCSMRCARMAPRGT